MFATSAKILSLAVIILSITGSVRGIVARADEQSPPSPPPPPPPITNDQPVSSHSWENESFERRAFREEMQQIRHEHEDLESEGASLKMKCPDTDVGACVNAKQAYHERRAKLHERVANLREKMEASRHLDQGHAHGFALGGPDKKESIADAPPSPVK